MELNKVKTERNYGIDLLRIVSMLFVVALHTLNQGGILNNTEPFSFKYFFSYFLYIAAFCAVNCYGLITGYVGYSSSKHKYSNLINLYLQTSFYALLSVIFYLCFKPEVINIESLFDVVFPFLIESYWYFGAYFAMFFFIPIINKGIQACEKKYLDMFVAFILLFFAVYSTVITRDYFDLKRGYTFFWLIILYIIGAYIRKYEIDKKISNIKCIAVYLFMVVAVFGLKLVWEYYGLKQTGEFVLKGGLFICYIALPILLCAVSLLLLFAKLNVKGVAQKIVKFSSPLAFGVYLCHSSEFFWSEILSGLFSGVVKCNSVIFILGVIGAILSVYLVSMVIEFIRSKLFELCRIKKFSIWLEALIIKIVSKCFSIFDKSDKKVN